MPGVQHEPSFVHDSPGSVHFVPAPWYAPMPDFALHASYDSSLQPDAAAASQHAAGAGQTLVLLPDNHVAGAKSVIASQAVFVTLSFVCPLAPQHAPMSYWQL